MATADAGDAGAGSGGATAPQDLVLKVLGAIGTGVGVLGFVAFFGGAILWLRVERAGLPANDAIAQVPKSVLITTGANFLVPAFLIALLAVLAIFAVYLLANLPRQKSVRGATQEVETLRDQADSLRADAKTKSATAQATGKLLAQANGDAATALLAPAQSQTKEAVDATRALEAKEAEVKEKEDAGKFKLTQTPVQSRVELWVGFLAVLLLPPLLNQAIFSVGFFWSGLILIGVALAAAAASAVIYLSTQNLIWFGITVFVTVGVYLGVATYYSTTRNLKVEPAAALRGENAPVVGSFIADSGSNLYLGTFPEDTQGPPHLIIIPRSQVTALAVGPLTDPATAPRSAVRLALEECERKVDIPKTEKDAARVEPVCTTDQQAVLSAELKP
jgi:F0F1-type ATP synthase membrane subunit b/b'